MLIHERYTPLVACSRIQVLQVHENQQLAQKVTTLKTLDLK